MICPGALCFKILLCEFSSVIYTASIPKVLRLHPELGFTGRLQVYHPDRLSSTRDRPRPLFQHRWKPHGLPHSTITTSLCLQASSSALSVLLVWTRCADTWPDSSPWTVISVGRRRFVRLTKQISTCSFKTQHRDLLLSDVCSSHSLYKSAPQSCASNCVHVPSSLPDSNPHRHDYLARGCRDKHYLPTYSPQEN